MSTHYSHFVNAKKTAEAVIKELDEPKSKQYEDRARDESPEHNLASELPFQFLRNT
jgi:hypothetical protein